MAERIEYLLDKYWAGESSLDEEKELKALLKTTDLFTIEREFFGELHLLKAEEPIPKNPSKRSFGKDWLKIAAVFALFLALSAAMFQFRMYQERHQEALAYAQVMEAFSLINQNMQKGTNQLEAMEEFRHLNTAHELFQQIKD